MVREDSHGEVAGDEPDPTLPAGERSNPASESHDVTRILSRIEQGDGQAAEQLLPLVYEELRKLAAQMMAQENPGQTLQATALVHEAYIRLVGDAAPQHWEGRRHFFAAAAEAMRRILVDSARHKKSLKASGGLKRVQLDDAAAAIEISCDDVLDLNEAVERLSREDPQAASVAKLRLFAGLTLEEVAACQSQPTTSVFRHWTYARAFLQMHVCKGGLGSQ